MTSIIFVTQVMDPDDPVLGFVVHQVRALAARDARVVVIANEVRSIPSDLDADVVSLGKERGWGRARRAMEYQRQLTVWARRLRPATLFAHMCPIYLNAGVATVRAHGGRTMLWFAHPSVTSTLVAAERLADVVLTTLPGSYPRRSAKVRVVGQAIDTARFVAAADGPALAADPAVGAAAQPTCRLLALGRTAPVKGYPTIVKGLAAARALGADVSLSITGPSVTDAERTHRGDLEQLIDELGVGDWVTIEGALAHREVPGRLASATALVNATCVGSADKSVFEAMACGRPVLFSNPALAEVLSGAGMDLSFDAEDPASLAARICELVATPPDRLRSTGAELRRRVELGHSLDHWADTVLAVAAELHGRPAVGAAR